MNMATGPAKREFVYIAGPISGIDGENREAFEEAMSDVYFSWRKEPVSPHDICAEVKNGTWLTYMAKCVPALMQCNAIYLLRGWWWSRGARWEFVIARFLCRLPVTFQGGFWGGFRR